VFCDEPPGPRAYYTAGHGEVQSSQGAGGLTGSASYREPLLITGGQRANALHSIESDTTNPSGKKKESDPESKDERLDQPVEVALYRGKPGTTIEADHAGMGQDTESGRSEPHTRPSPAGRIPASDAPRRDLTGTPKLERRSGSQ